jgi:hypothetical protein
MNVGLVRLLSALGVVRHQLHTEVIDNVPHQSTLAFVAIKPTHLCLIMSMKWITIEKDVYGATVEQQLSLVGNESLATAVKEGTLLFKEWCSLFDDQVASLTSLPIVLISLITDYISMLPLHSFPSLLLNGSLLESTGDYPRATGVRVDHELSFAPASWEDFPIYIKDAVAYTSSFDD